jgi:hypothetical protein
MNEYGALCLADGFSLGAMPAGDAPGEATWYENHASTHQPRAAAAIAASIEKELADGRITYLGAAHDRASLQQLLGRHDLDFGIVHPLAVVDNGRKLRVIHDASHPKHPGPGQPPSANARVWINAEMTQAGAAHFRAVVCRLRHALPGRRLLAAKYDIEAAYRQLIYDGSCRELLLFHYEGRLYIHGRPSFGTCSSAAHFVRVQLAVQWAVRNDVNARCAELQECDAELAFELSLFESLSIVDDTVLVTTERAAAELRAIFISLHTRWGLPLQPDKLAREGNFGPILTWAGITYDLDLDQAWLDASRRHEWASAIAAVLDSAPPRAAGFQTVEDHHSPLSTDLLRSSHPSAGPEVARAEY